MGAALLRCFLADPDPDLARVIDPPEDLGNELWVMRLPDFRRSPRIRALTRHLAQGLRPSRDLIAGKRPQPGAPLSRRPRDLPRLASRA